AATNTEGKALSGIIPEACNATTVYFGFTPQLANETLQSSCQPGSLRTNFDGDSAAVTLLENPPAEYEPVSIWSGGDVPDEGRKAYIIHYPDMEDQLALPPGGKIKLPTAQATVDDCEVLGGFDISEWDLDRTLPFSLRH